MRLQVWRLRSADEENYKFYYELIGQTDYQSAADMGNGTHTFAIWPRTKIRVASNDTIGKTSPHGPDYCLTVVNN